MNYFENIRLQTPVNDIPCKFGISYNDKILMLGSCFADNIGKRLIDLGFDAMTNPFGTLYNPQSLLNSIERISSCELFRQEDCVEMGAGAGRVCSFSHHTSFSRASQEEFLENANTILKEASAFFRRTDKVIITLGTAWCYRSLEKDIVVSNCLKRPSREFSRERMSEREVTDCLEKIVRACEGKKVIFTVSPIRHMSDGAHGNQLSKSSLLLGVDQVTRFDDLADYFPSYEIMMDELRDYRFYAEDMCHPTKQAEEYILSRFLKWALPCSEYPILEENIRAFKRSLHRSSSPSF